MKLIVTYTYEEMSALCANIIVSTFLQDKRVNVSLTGGSTPKRMYELLLKEVAMLPCLEHIHYYTFDETPIRNKDNVVVAYDNYTGLKKSFFEPGKVSESNIHFMNDENYKQFPLMIQNDGGLDLMVIGMGEDGHFCANMPECTKYDKEVYAIKLTNEYPWNEPYQNSLQGNYSDYMYTLGLPSLLKVKRLLLIVNGKTKAKALKRALEGPMDPKFPSSYLRLHQNLTVIADKEASNELTK